MRHVPVNDNANECYASEAGLIYADLQHQGREELNVNQPPNFKFVNILLYAGNP